VVLARMLRKYRRPRLMWLVPFYPVFACLYGLGLVALLITTRRVEWKARHF